MTRLGVLRRGLVVLVVGALVACSPQPNGDAKKRVATLAADPIRTLLPPGGKRLGESRVAGHKTQAPFGQSPPTVRRSYTFTGDARLAARSVLDQGRAAGWFVTVDCALASDGTFWVRGAKRFKDSTGTFAAGFEAQVWTRPVEGEQPPRQEVILEILTPYPGEKPPLGPETTPSTSASAATCLD